MLAVLDILAGYLTLAPGGVADDIEAAQLHVELFQEAVIPHPVGQHMPQPRAALTTIIIGAWNADLLSTRFFHMYKFGHIHLPRLRIDHHNRWMAPFILQSKAMRSHVWRSRPHHPGHQVAQGERTFDHWGQLIADINSFPIARIRATNLLTIIIIPDGFELLAGVLSFLDGAVFAACTGRTAFGPYTPAGAGRHQLLMLVAIIHPHILHEDPSGHLATFFLEVGERHGVGEAIAQADGMEPLPIAP